MYWDNNRIAGFTLIEMLIGISIMLILSVLALNGYNSLIKRSHDDVRMTHLRQLSLALEAYKTDNIAQGYPNNLTDLEYDYIESTIPEDPLGYSYYYTKTSDGYELCAYLELGGTDTCGNNCNAPGDCNYQIIP